MGMERTGLAALAFLRARGDDAIPTDLTPRTLDGFRLQTEELLDENWDAIVLSPGVPADLPGLERARRRGVDVMGEVELAAPYLKGPVIGITGSNGKTTTTSLVGHILESAGTPFQLGGNIGTPVISMTGSSRDDQWNVLELSSFQLETVHTFRAHVGICLNVTQNHLDRHYSFEQYVAAKGNLFRNQVSGDYAVLNSEDAVCRSFAATTKAAAVWFSGREIERLMPSGSVLIPGSHNAENVMAAAAAARIVGIGREDIVSAVRTFKAVEHRLEFVAEMRGVRFYNDSKATSVDATTKALESFAGRLWVILGGKDKGSDYTLLRKLLQSKAHAALLIGAAADKIAVDLAGAVNLKKTETLAGAVQYAWKHAQPGDTVLLAPACASFDQFTGYEHRGRVFKELVRGLDTNGAAA